MNTTTQSIRDASAEAPADKMETPATAAFTMLVHRNIERLASLQKTTLDMLSSQTIDITDTMRRSLKPTAAAPAAAFIDFAAHSLEHWVNAQKNILDLVVQQSAHTAEAVEERQGAATHSVSQLSDLVQQSAERTAAAQKAMLDFAAKQNKAAADAFQRQAGVAGTPMEKMAESMEHGVATFIETQKEFLETATKIAKSAAAKAAGS